MLNGLRPFTPAACQAAAGSMPAVACEQRSRNALTIDEAPRSLGTGPARRTAKPCRPRAKAVQVLRRGIAGVVLVALGIQSREQRLGCVRHARPSFVPIRIAARVLAPLQARRMRRRVDLLELVDRDVRVDQMCSGTFDLLSAVSCYAQ